MTSLSPCHILYAAILQELVYCGRGYARNREIEVFADCSSTISVCCFLSDYIKATECVLFDYFSQFEADLSNKSSFTPNQIKSFGELVTFSNVGDLEDFVTSLASIVDMWESNINENSVTSILRVSPSSIFGLFIRSFVATFETYSFEQTVMLFSQLDHFLSESKPYSMQLGINAIAYLVGRVKDIRTVTWVPDDDISVYSLEAGISYVCGDMKRCEEYMQLIFDYDCNTSTSIPPVFLSSKQIKAKNELLSIMINYHNLKSSLKELHGPSQRYQYLMLALSSMWCGLGFQRKAWNGIQEALRMAHQKGDHVAIVGALLLIYHIKRFNLDVSHVSGTVLNQQLDSSSFDLSFHDISELNESSSPSISDPSSSCLSLNRNLVIAIQTGEDLLLRCLDRCMHHEMGLVSSMAAFLLCQHRAGENLQSDHYYAKYGLRSLEKNILASPFMCLESHFDIDLKLASENGAHYRHLRSSSIQCLWTLLVASSFGDENLTNAVAKLRGIEQLDGVLSSLWTDQLAPGATGKASHKETCLTEKENLRTGFFYHLLASQLWKRFGVLDMALLEIRRCLRMYGSSLTNKIMVTVLMEAQSIIQEIGCRRNRYEQPQQPQQPSAEKTEAALYPLSIQYAYDLLKTTKQLFPVTSIKHFGNAIEIMYGKVRYHLYRKSKNYGEALRCAESNLLLMSGKSLHEIMELVAQDQLMLFAKGLAPVEGFLQEYELLDLLFQLLEVMQYVNLSSTVTFCYALEHMPQLENYLLWKTKFRNLRHRLMMTYQLPLHETSMGVFQLSYLLADQIGYPTLLLELPFPELGDFSCEIHSN